MKRIVIFFAFILFLLNLSAQGELKWMLYDVHSGEKFKNGVTSFWYNSLYGLMNSSGEVLIEPQFKYSFEFKDGVAIVQDPKTDLSGVINSDGEYVIPPKYKSIYRSKCGFFETRDSECDASGLLTTKGKEVLPLSIKNTYISISSDSTVAFDQEGKSGLINKYGELIFAPKYESAGSIKGTRIAYGKINDSTLVKHLDYPQIQIMVKYISSNGSPFVKLIYKDSVVVVDGNLKKMTQQQKRSKSGIFAFADPKTNRWGFKNQKGVILIPPRYEDVDDFFYYNIMRVYANGKWGIVSGETGKEIVPPTYKSLAYSSNGIMEITLDADDKSNNNGLMFTDGTVVLPPNCKYIQLVEDSLYRITVEKDVAKEGVFIAKKGAPIPKLYDGVYLPEGNMFIVYAEKEKIKYFGVVNKKGEEVLPTEYKYIFGPSDGLFYVADFKENRAFFDTQGKCVMNYETDEYRCSGLLFSEGVIQSYDKKGNKDGYISNPLLDPNKVQLLYQQTTTESAYKPSNKTTTILLAENTVSTATECKNLLDKGWGYFKVSNYQPAVECAMQALNGGGNKEDCYFLIGCCFHNVEDYDNAINYYQKTLDVNSGHKSAAKNLKAIKRAKRWAIAAQVLSGVSAAMNQSVNLMNTINNSGSGGYSSSNSVPASSSYSSPKTATMCSMCKGTGRINTNDTPAFGITEKKWCKDCKEWVSYSHCHGCKICPSCNGKGTR